MSYVQLQSGKTEQGCYNLHCKKLELKWDNIKIRVGSDNSHCVVRRT